MIRGRKPKPTAVRVLDGNPGHRPINDREPTHAALDPACPEELTDPIARAEWDRVAPSLSQGHVTTVDRATLLGYCLKYAQWRGLEAAAAGFPYIVKAPSGYPIPNPAIGMANKCFALLLRAAVELGITPSSRSRVVASEQAAEDAFAAVQRARPTLTRVK